MRNIAATLAILASVACGSSPSAPDGPPATFLLRLYGAPQTSMRLTINGVDYSGVAKRDFTVSLKPGSYEASGSADNGGMAVTFSTVTREGVEASSIATITGEKPYLTPCSVAYEVGNVAVSFRFRFRVTREPSRACSAFVYDEATR